MKVSHHETLPILSRVFLVLLHFVLVRTRDRINSDYTSFGGHTLGLRDPHSIPHIVLYTLFLSSQ